MSTGLVGPIQSHCLANRHLVSSAAVYSHAYVYAPVYVPVSACVSWPFPTRRIYKVYRRSSTVIYPPIALEDFSLQEQKQDFYLTASRMVPYKKIDLIVKSFSHMPDKQLIVIGSGPDFEKIKKIAPPNVTLLGYQPFAVLLTHLQEAKAFIFAAEEDFGIAPLEAQACGTPVIAYNKGGASETILGHAQEAHRTGVFFAEQSIEAICKAVQHFEALPVKITPQDCRANAQRFSKARFDAEFVGLVERARESFGR